MIAVIFEVQPKPERYREYLDIAASLKDDLEKIDGFISIERFESIYQKGKILSLSLWQDEEAVRAWRLYPAHRDAQVKGRFEIFRITVSVLLKSSAITECLIASRRHSSRRTCCHRGNGRVACCAYSKSRRRGQH